MPWKATLALRMKTETDFANVWLAEKLGMESPTHVGKRVGLVRAGRLRLKSMTGAALMERISRSGARA